MAPSGPSVLGSSDRLEGPLTPTGGPGQEEHGLSYDSDFGEHQTRGSVGP